jgi:acetyl-CoA C-acetyltransferase
VILSTARTPIGSFQGVLSTATATQLGVHVVKEALKRAKVDPKQVNEVILGNVVSSGVGQAPATQVTFRAGIPYNVPSTTINKVCSSGMKSVAFAAQSIALGQNQVVVAGGFESMSNIPFYLPKARSGQGLGNGVVEDGILKDGLWDAFDDHHMGMAAEHCSKQYSISRQDQDAYALESFRRASEAQKAGRFNDEIAPITIKTKKGEVTVSEDESPAKLKADKVPTLKPAFTKEGSVTAANSSSINDGACAIVLASAKWAEEQGLKPIARIVAYIDAQQKPIDFTTSPSVGIPAVLKRAGLTLAQMDAIEINEAFSVVALANMKILGLDHAKLNVNGGAVALGHPIGASGARLIGSLITVLKQKKGKYGVASICNGGGGASSMVIELL